MSEPLNVTPGPPQSAPPMLLSGNPLSWLKVFGPGAIIASLTIGTGELIFSTRGGALFGYNILFLFVVISILKWGLVLGTARHMVLTGVHPFQRMMNLPGPRGWAPMAFFILAAICMPIWVSFHSGVLGNLTSWVSGTEAMFHGGADFVWGAAILSGLLLLSATEGYTVLERVQLAIVAALIICAGISLVLYNPDWWALLKGAVIPPVYEYPTWIGEYPKIAAQPVWVETTRYVGVIGGAGYDYLAYTSFLREKRWGNAGAAPATRQKLESIAADPNHPVRRWLRAPYIDCSISFIIVIAFSAVFVASGTIVLAPEHKIPDEKNLLNLQAEFVVGLSPVLLPLYVAGAFLTMLGTLYGTLEVAHTVLNEMARSVNDAWAAQHQRRLKTYTVSWCAVVAYGVLAWQYFYTTSGGADKPRALLAVMTPANLFTGVLLCGLLCLLNPWMDHRFLPRALRMPRWLWLLNLFAAAVFLALGIKGYWDHDSRWLALGGLCVVVAVAWGLAFALRGRLSGSAMDGE